MRAEECYRMAAELDAHLPDWSVMFGEHSGQFIAIGSTGLLYAASVPELGQKIGRTRAVPRRGGGLPHPATGLRAPILPEVSPPRTATGRFTDYRGVYDRI